MKKTDKNAPAADATATATADTPAGSRKGRPKSVKLSPANANRVADLADAVLSGDDAAIAAITDKEFCDFETGASFTGRDLLVSTIAEMRESAAKIVNG